VDRDTAGARQEGEAGHAAGGPSMGGLLADLAADVMSLAQAEGRLAKAEVIDRGQKIARGVAMLGAALAVLIVAGVILAGALTAALAPVVGPAAAALIVGLCIGVLGIMLLMAGRRRLGGGVTPVRTMAQVRRDGQLVRDKL
jgi:hypothetical protein